MLFRLQISTVSVRTSKLKNYHTSTMKVMLYLDVPPDSFNTGWGNQDKKKNHMEFLQSHVANSNLVVNLIELQQTDIYLPLRL